MLKKSVCIILCLCLTAAFFACSGKKEAAMRLEGESVSEAVYAYYLACYKQYWLSALGQTDDPSFWQTENEGVTNADRLTEISEEAIKKRLVCCYLFNKSGLKLTDSELYSVDKMIAGIKASLEDKNGIENDEVFKKLNVGESDLKEVLIMDSKVGAYQDYLYGENGVDKITDAEREEYYKNNYYRFELLYLMNSDFVRDENGNIVYDGDKNAKVTEISDERYEEKLALAKDILEKVRNGGDIREFIEEYSEQLEKGDYKNGHYLCSVNEYGTVISAAVMKLKTGETGLLQLPTGIYIIQRTELDDGGWGKEINQPGEDFYNFEDLVREYDFDNLLKPYYEKTETVKEITEKYKMEELPYTFSWQYLF